MEIIKNVIAGYQDYKPLVADVFFRKNGQAKPVVVYCHGFKGFKDWADFDAIATLFVKEGFVFVKFNLSHNGMSATDQDNFSDPEAFGNNNATKELADLSRMTGWVEGDNQHIPSEEKDPEKIYLIGHSRGGGDAIVFGSMDPRIRKIAAWAAISDYSHIWKKWGKEELAAWKLTGKAFTLNARTGQQMPLYYQLYEDYLANQERLNILKAVSRLNVPLLVCHGSEDEAVSVKAAYAIHQACKGSELYIVEGSDHVFRRKHPATGKELPDDTLKVVRRTVGFFNRL